MAAPPPKPIWVRQAEEAKLKSEAEKAAAAKAAFEATFKSIDKPTASDSGDSDSEGGGSGGGAAAAESGEWGPLDPSRCTAAGPGVAGGAACAPATFTVVARDSDGRRVPRGGARARVVVSPAAGVGGGDIDGTVKDHGDGSYSVTYAVPKRGNYMVHVELDGKPIMGSPFPVFFSAAGPVASASSAAAAVTASVASSTYPNMINQTMPNMPNYAASVSGAFPGLLGMLSAGGSGGVVLQGVGASLGEVCREYLNGRCAKTDCKFNHPPQQLLMSVLAATTSMGTLSQAPMAPSAAAMAAAQAIMAAQALQAHAAQMQAKAAKSSEGSSGSPDKTDKGDALKKTVQVSNLSPLLTVDHLKQLFGYCGTVVDCIITDSKHFAYIEYLKPEEAAAALALNNMDVGGRPLNVEMAKTLPSKTSSLNTSLPMMMQQAVQLQQMQFQQALVMQQTLASQQAAARAATMKSATEAAAARAAEISKKLKADGLGGGDDKDTEKKSRSPSPLPRRSKSRSRSPMKYRRSRRSRTFSPPVRRDRRSRSPVRSYHSKYGSDRSYRDNRDSYSRSGRRERDQSRDHYSSSSKRNRSRSVSPRYKKPSRADSRSPKRHRESLSPRPARSTRASSKSPRHHKGGRSSPTREHCSSHRGRHSRSRSRERKHHHSDRKDTKKSDMQEDTKRSHRSNRDGKDEISSRDHGEEGRVDTSSAAHKRSPSSSEDEMLNTERRSKHKKSKQDVSLENIEMKDEERIGEGLELNEDKRSLHSPRSKSQKRSLVDKDDRHSPSHDTSRHSKARSDSKKHEKDDSTRKERNYAADEARHYRDDKSSHRSSSRSHRSSRHSRERYSRDTADKHKSKKSEESFKPRKAGGSLEDSSDKRKERTENFPSLMINKSAAGSDNGGIQEDYGKEDSPGQKNDKSRADLAIDGAVRKFRSTEQDDHFEQDCENQLMHYAEKHVYAGHNNVESDASLAETDLVNKEAQCFVHQTDCLVTDIPDSNDNKDCVKQKLAVSHDEQIARVRHDETKELQTDDLDGHFSGPGTHECPFPLEQVKESDNSTSEDHCLSGP